ncbi:MAG: hypothetical protein K0R28_2203 [Paenibacillus sp.]|nr:hypothetical protein [Paenibacillus sp.]
MSISIVSLNVGKPQSFIYKGKEVPTGIFKKPADDGPIVLTVLNFAGDGQADPVNHGGLDKAICVYPYEHYPYWEKELGRKLDFGAFGRLQVTQPRQPCHKLAKKYDLPELPALVQNTGYTGFYLRVLVPGLFDRALPLTLAERHPHGITVAYANRIKHHDKHNIEGIRAILAVGELSESWRASFEKRLSGNEPSADERLNGTK